MGCPTALTRSSRRSPGGSTSWTRLSGGRREARPTRRDVRRGRREPASSDERLEELDASLVEVAGNPVKSDERLVDLAERLKTRNGGGFSSF
jgi:hypothetical protein